MKLIIDIAEETYINVNSTGLFLCPRDKTELEKAIKCAIPYEERQQGEWIPVSERLPEQNGYYITTCRDICENRVHTVGFDGVRKKWGRGGVIAWQPLPEPYKQG